MNSIVSGHVSDGAYTNAFTFTIYIYQLAPFPNEGGGRRRGWGRYAQGKTRLSNGEEPAPTDVIIMAKIRFSLPLLSSYLFPPTWPSPSQQLQPSADFARDCTVWTRKIASRRHHLCACVCPWPISEKGRCRSFLQLVAHLSVN